MTRSRTRSLREKFILAVERLLEPTEQDLTEIRHQGMISFDPGQGAQELNDVELKLVPGQGDGSKDTEKTEEAPRSFQDIKNAEDYKKIPAAQDQGYSIHPWPMLREHKVYSIIMFHAGTPEAPT
uniref:Uncharacterized protein n=1 Tax=Noccaea caerulescens TaxID=107243 RepID=A0A1J3IRY6_NOCCA